MTPRMLLALLAMCLAAPVALAATPAYWLIARNRHRLPGATEACAMPEMQTGRPKPPRATPMRETYASALAFSWSNSACVIVPASSMALACAIWSVGEALPATDFT